VGEDVNIVTRESYYLRRSNRQPTDVTFATVPGNALTVGSRTVAGLEPEAREGCTAMEAGA
jgi:hypothetical protein